MKYIYSCFFLLYIQVLQANHSLSLSQEEKAYIKKNSPVSLCIQYEQLPIDGYVNKQHIGIMSDIYNEITESTGLKFRPVILQSREELDNNVANAKCDVLSVYPSNCTKYKRLKATQSFTKTYFTLISKLDKSFASGTHLLRDKIFVTQSSVYKKYITDLYPYLIVRVIEDKSKMVEAVLKGEAYAIIAFDEQADYIIDKFGYGKLKINGFLAKKRALKMSIGIQKDKPILFSIIDKSLQNIHPDEVNNIIKSWRLTRYQKVTDYNLVFTILGVMSFFLFILIYYQRRLTNFNKELEKQVCEKTRALREINEYLEDTVSQKVEELIHKDKIMTMQAKQAVMGEMISMVAHQWRQPLNTITLKVSNLQIKQMIGKKIDCTEFVPALDEISQTLGYLSETIDDFKTYFHPEKESVEVELDELLQKALNFVLPRAKLQNVKVIISKASAIKTTVYQNELIQVLLNLLNNAIDAYENIQDNEKIVELYAMNEDKEVWICVEDIAGGIKEEYLEQIFEPYFSTKGKNGTGLGLYMSQMIIEKQFSGKIDVKTNKNGTLFIIKIPKVHHV